MKYLIILPEGEATKRKVMEFYWDYIAKIDDEDYTEITDAIEKVTDRPKNHNA